MVCIFVRFYARFIWQYSHGYGNECQGGVGLNYGYSEGRRWLRRAIVDPSTVVAEGSTTPHYALPLYPA
jgi:hypothetical protein